MSKQIVDVDAFSPNHAHSGQIACRCLDRCARFIDHDQSRHLVQTQRGQHSEDLLRLVVVEGLEVGGDADVSLKSGDRGAAVAVSENVTSLTTGDLRVFQITRAGASAAAVVTAAKYYRDEGLN